MCIHCRKAATDEVPVSIARATGTQVGDLSLSHWQSHTEEETGEGLVYGACAQNMCLWNVSLHTCTLCNSPAIIITGPWLALQKRLLLLTKLD